MARQYVVTEEEMISLIESLELARLREFERHAPSSCLHREDIDSVHRTFHMIAVRWAQQMGFNGYRK